MTSQSFEALARAFHTFLLSPVCFQFRLNALVDRQIHSPTFAGTVDRDSHPVEALFQNFNTHLDAKLVTVMSSMAISHVGPD